MMPGWTVQGRANVASETLVAGVPILAPAMPGSIGRLGHDHPGCFPVRHTGALATLLHQGKTDRQFLEALRRHCAARAPLFSPAHERDAWHALRQAFSDATRSVRADRSAA